MSQAPSCADCGASAELATGVEVYPNRPDLADKMLWRCVCGAHVGCHPGTTKPFGSPAGQDTRAARIAAHAAFDPLWRAKQRRECCSKKAARGAGYKWLADQLGIDRDACHIGMMDASMARRVVEVIRAARANAP